MAGRRGSSLEGWLSTPGRGSPQRARHRRRAARGAGAALVSLGWLGTRSSRTRQHCACRPRSGPLQNGDSGASPPALPTGRGLRLQAPPWPPGVRAESCNHPANEPRRSDRHEEARTSLDPPLQSPKFNRVWLLWSDLGRVPLAWRAQGSSDRVMPVGRLEFCVSTTLLYAVVDTQREKGKGSPPPAQTGP